MIWPTMVFLLAVSAVACAGAYLVESGLRGMGVATRFTWLGAMALGPALVGVRALSLLRGAPSVAPDWAPVIELPPLALAPAGPVFPGPWLEAAAAAVWLLSGFALVALVVRTHRVLLRERSGWESTQVLGRDVYVSADWGPAVAGMWDPWIVLPRWVLALRETELRMVLLHEEEHMRARDTRMLGGALALVALSAWNPLTWWQLRRLRSAMEVDCDRRVLRAVRDRPTCGASLLAVAARASGPSLGLAAFTERSLNLKRRILTMTAKTSGWTAMGGVVLVVLGLVVGVQACGVETPVGLTPRAGIQPAVDEASPTAEAEGTRVTPGGGEVFTPFTVAPSILNRDEVVAAMVREYPPELREQGIGGTVRVYFLIDEEGNVARTILDRSSGRPAIDDAALKVAATYRFTPALNKDKKVPVWVSFPLTFQKR